MQSRSGFERLCVCLLVILRYDVAFDGAGAIGDGEPGGDGGLVFAESFAETAQLANRAGLRLAGLGFEVLAAGGGRVRRRSREQRRG